MSRISLPTLPSLNSKKSKNTNDSGDSKGDIEKALRKAFAIAEEKGLTDDDFLKKAFVQYCRDAFKVENRKEMTTTQWQKLYRTLQNGNKVVEQIRLNGKKIEMETLIEDIVSATGDAEAGDIEKRLLGSADLDAIDDADLETLNGWINTLHKLKDEGDVADWVKKTVVLNF